MICFLFVENDDLNSMLSLRVGLDGQLDHPLRRRTIEEIRGLQENAKTIVVFPSIWCGVFMVALPLLSDTKARIAIPFALEDQLAKPLTQVHCAFDKGAYSQGRYQVVVIDKAIISDWMAKLRNLDLNYDYITIDWFALHPGEAIGQADAWLIHTEEFHGAIRLDLWEHRQPAWAKELQWQGFSDNASAPEGRDVIIHAQSQYDWIAERLSKAKFVNLCQGEFQHASSETQVKHKYRLAGLLGVLWLVSFIGIHLGLSKLIMHQSEQIDQKIAQAYRKFFPDAKAIISPKFRIEQLLKHNQMGHNSVLWSLVESWSLAIRAQEQPLPNQSVKSGLTIQTMQFQNQILTVMFQCHNFSVLEKIEAFLQRRQVHVHQISAATENEQVAVKWELSL